MATRDELWSRGRLFEHRLSHGIAFEDERGIVATDERDDALVATCDAAMERLHAHVLDDARVRLVAEATDEGVTSTMTIRIGALSIVTTPEHVEHDVALLRAAVFADARPVDATLPIVWLHGSASVLLHEAVGHAAEHGHAPLAWPSWLRVEDEGADLLRGEPPSRLRRATFRDVPLRRMTNLIASQEQAPFAWPEERIEVLLVDGGAYEPLTETVTLHFAAARHVRGERVTPAAPFTIERSRAEVARALRGATGAPLRYPGVICSREGQELVVGSHAPIVLTVFA
jgi:hypothetical protein